MNYQLTSKDAPKITLAVVLLVALCTTVWVKSRKATSQREQTSMMVQMNREMGIPIIDNSRPKEERSQEQDDQQEQLSAQSRSNPPR